MQQTFWKSHLLTGGISVIARYWLKAISDVFVSIKNMWELVYTCIHNVLDASCVYLMEFQGDFVVAD